MDIIHLLPLGRPWGDGHNWRLLRKAVGGILQRIYARITIIPANSLTLHTVVGSSYTLAYYQSIVNRIGTGFIITDGRFHVSRLPLICGQELIDNHVHSVITLHYPPATSAALLQTALKRLKRVVQEHVFIEVIAI